MYMNIYQLIYQPTTRLWFGFHPVKAPPPSLSCRSPMFFSKSPQVWSGLVWSGLLVFPFRFISHQEHFPLQHLIYYVPAWQPCCEIRFDRGQKSDEIWQTTSVSFMRKCDAKVNINMCVCSPKSCIFLTFKDFLNVGVLLLNTWNVSGFRQIELFIFQIFNVKGRDMHSVYC